MSAEVEHDYDFSSPSADASLTTPIQASQLAKGDFILIDGHPCKITSKSTSKPGKHGHAKISFEALSLLTAKKHTALHPTHATVASPLVTRREFLLLYFSTADGFLSLWDSAKGETKDDVRLPAEEGEMRERLAKLYQKGEGEIWVSVLATMGEERVDGVRVVEEK
ncbi:MAG: hypothetical protein Q9220_003221 [cf. Caloplaca sp. 1 TL-2023]